jgi:GntR family transcriptional regulator
MHTAEHIVDALRLNDTGVPIYVQLRDQFLGAIGAGLLRPGDQMPTMRQVAVALRVDLNTVRHAYDQLEKLGAVTLIRGRGSFVADLPPTAGGADPAAAAEDLARQTLTRAAALGVSPILILEKIAALAANKEDYR